MTESGFWKVVLSREFSIALMEELGGMLIVFLLFFVLFLWFRIMWLDHKMMKRCQDLEELIHNPGLDRDRFPHSEQDKGK